MTSMGDTPSFGSRRTLAGAYRPPRLLKAGLVWRWLRSALPAPMSVLVPCQLWLFFDLDQTRSPIFSDTRVEGSYPSGNSRGTLHNAELCD